MLRVVLLDAIQCFPFACCRLHNRFSMCRYSVSRMLSPSTADKLKALNKVVVYRNLPYVRQRRAQLIGSFVHLVSCVAFVILLFTVAHFKMPLIQCQFQCQFQFQILRLARFRSLLGSWLIIISNIAALLCRISHQSDALVTCSCEFIFAFNSKKTHSVGYSSRENKPQCMSLLLLAIRHVKLPIISPRPR